MLVPPRRELRYHSCSRWVLVTSVALICAAACRRDQSATAVPAFTLPQVRGGIFQLRPGQSQAVLLAFLQTVPDTADTPSRDQVPFLRSMSHQYSARGLKIVIVDSSALVTHELPTRDALINASYDWRRTPPIPVSQNLHARCGMVVQRKRDSFGRQKWRNLQPSGPAMPLRQSTCHCLPRAHCSCALALAICASNDVSCFL